jgi:aryl-alcohol dehydrogenase-like predicted oxidoreductase
MNPGNESSRFELAPDYSISRVIKGGWQISTGHTPNVHLEREQAADDIVSFIENGVTTLDFGDIYLGVEETVGLTLKKLGKEARDRVQLHTKYVPDINILSTHQFSDAEAIIHRSRARLGVDRLDLVQFHWWDYEVPGYVDALRDLARLQRQGYIRLLGVTNFDVPRMKEFVEAGITPASIQLQYSLLDRRPEHGMASFCEQHDIKMLCYGTVAGGFLSERYLNAPEPSQPYANRSLIKYKLIIDEFGGWETFQKLLQTLHSIAAKYESDIASVASAYVLAKPGVAGVIVGAKDRSHLHQNVRLMQLRLDADDEALIEQALDGARDVPGDVYDLERNDPRHAGIMHKVNNAK